MNRLFRSAMLFALCGWVVPTQAHFSMAPKIAVEPLPLPQPETTLFRSGTSSASRGDFSDYLERLVAFDTKYQRLQPSFAAHFDLLRGVAFFHPDNVHKYIDTIKAVRGNPVTYQFAVRLWVKAQIGMYARLAELLDGASRAGLEQSPEVSATLDFYAAGVKTALLEELIVLGDMEPSVAGVRAFVEGKDARALRVIARGVEDDTALIPPEEQRRLKDRWRRFRHDLLAQVQPVNRCESVEKSSEPGETVIIEVGRHRLSFAAYRAVFGVPETERLWAGQRRGNCARMVLFYAMADLVDELGILPARLEKDIRVSREIYLMGRQLAAEAGAELLETGGPRPSPLETARQLMQHPKVIEVKDWLVARQQGRTSQDAGRFLDGDFIDTTDWTLERRLAPKHSIHM